MHMGQAITHQGYNPLYLCCCPKEDDETGGRQFEGSSSGRTNRVNPFMRVVPPESSTVSQLPQTVDIINEIVQDSTRPVIEPYRKAYGIRNYAAPRKTREAVIDQQLIVAVGKWKMRRLDAFLILLMAAADDDDNCPC